MSGTEAIQAAVVAASALLAAALGVLGTVRRGHWLTTLLFAAAFLALAAFQAGTLGILKAGGPAAARAWATYLAGSSALAAWLWLALSVVLARPDPLRRLQQAAVSLALALAGCVTMFFVADTPYVVAAVEGFGGTGSVVLGGMGKVYLLYLVVVMMAVLLNLEGMVRSAPGGSRERLRPLFVAFAIGIVSALLIVSSGLLYGEIRVSWMAAGAVPMFVAGVATAWALARRRLSDMAVPVARPVVYLSSVSLLLAAASLLVMAVLSWALPVVASRWQWAVGVGFYGLAGGAGLVLLLHPRSNRAVRRFIDRNFYAHRHDYRREWERVSRAITPTSRPEDLCAQIETLLRAVFDAGRTAIHLKDDRAGGFPLVHPAGAASLAGASAVISADNAVVGALQRARAPLILRDLSRDLDLIPIAVENRDFLSAFPAAVCAPLLVGDELVGILWLSAKRDDDSYSFEDAEFLGAMSRQLAAALWFARLADQLAESRQLESLHRLSSFVLHDIKNHVSGLSLVVENARRHLGEPEFQRDAMRVVERTVGSLRRLMGHVAGIGRPPLPRHDRVRVRDLVEQALGASGLVEGENHGVRIVVDCGADMTALLDPDLMARVLANLLTNAREAVPEAGEIRVAAAIEHPDGNGAGLLTLSVRDTGAGMSEEFVRDSLFRPFATTKTTGLGIGLAQCKSIVEAHGGTIRVESRPRAGTRFEIRVPLPRERKGP